MTMRLSNVLARRRDDRVVRELSHRFDQMTGVGVTNVEAMRIVFDLASRLNASPRARDRVSNHPPIRQTIQANRSAPFVRSYLGDPAVVLQFPGRASGAKVSATKANRTTDLIDDG
jgi:hypothetical protein